MLDKLVQTMSEEPTGDNYDKSRGYFTVWYLPENKKFQFELDDPFAWLLRSDIWAGKVGTWDIIAILEYDETAIHMSCKEALKQYEQL